jgi:cyclopropane-fatty-acyl-phospholipid synthase
MIEQLINLTEKGWVPDSLVRVGIRRLLKKRLMTVDLGDESKNRIRLQKLIDEFSAGPIAVVPEKANEQHYEVPAELFRLTLGPRYKYSSCYWGEGENSLQAAEEAALAMTCEHAELSDGMNILELGCGWGSLSLWMAEKYPNANLTVVSNSASQREHIESKAKQLGHEKNLTVVTSDINDFKTDQRFDRVVSVEMFEHVRNHKELLRKIASWLGPDGKLLVHIFCHRKFTYKFTDQQKSDWMSRYFFSGGIMPGDDLFSNYSDDLTIEKKWTWNGQHYQKTCEAWLANMDQNRDEIMSVLSQTYGEADAVRWFNRWRMFYLACSELFGYSFGNEWWVSHYRFAPKTVHGG